MPVTQQYWRILVNGTPKQGSGRVAIGELKFYDSTMIAISTSGGTASASSTNGGNTAANAFDSNTSTFWESSGSPTGGSNEWVRMQFASAVSVIACSITLTTNGVGLNEAPVTFLVQSSPDGSTWTTQKTISAYTGWFFFGQTAYFDASTVVGNARASQLAIEVNNKPVSNLVTSQVALELSQNPSPHAISSAVAMESLINPRAFVKCSTLCLEVIYPYVAADPSSIQQFMLP